MKSSVRNLFLYEEQLTVLKMENMWGSKPFLKSEALVVISGYQFHSTLDLICS